MVALHPTQQNNNWPDRYVNQRLVLIDLHLIHDMPRLAQKQHHAARHWQQHSYIDDRDNLIRFAA